MFNKLNENKTYIIAEIGSNHNGNFKLALKQIALAKKSGCDAVKFQTWDLTLNSEQTYLKNNKIFEEYQKYSLSYEQLIKLKKYSKKIKIDFGVSIFSKKELTNAVKLNVDFVKIASMDLNNYELIKQCSKIKKPLIISTGFSTEKEIIKSSKILKRAKKNNVVFLHCISLYPPKNLNLINLLNIKKIKNITGYKSGFSDHSLDSDVAISAASLGASVIEKHFTSNKKLKGWDHSISADFKEMKDIITKIKKINLIKGNYNRKLDIREIKQSKIMRRSIHIKNSLEKNKIILRDDLILQRPGNGMPPEKLTQIIGKKTKYSLKKGTLLKKNHIL
tara:strand:+ start:71 stop:1072 length:1002 start_codon:yes stop_codon:yes gene_type:complete